VVVKVKKRDQRRDGDFFCQHGTKGGRGCWKCLTVGAVKKGTKSAGRVRERVSGGTGAPIKEEDGKGGSSCRGRPLYRSKPGCAGGGRPVHQPRACGPQGGLVVG